MSLCESIDRPSESRSCGEAEEAGLQKYEQQTGLEAVRDQVRATHPDGCNARFYDGLAKKPDGTYEGVEVKSGSATRNAQQRAFDALPSTANPATATLNGETIQITSVRLVNV